MPSLNLPSLKAQLQQARSQEDIAQYRALLLKLLQGTDTTQDVLSVLKTHRGKAKRRFDHHAFLVSRVLVSDPGDTIAQRAVEQLWQAMANRADGGALLDMFARATAVKRTNRFKKAFVDQCLQHYPLVNLGKRKGSLSIEKLAALKAGGEIQRLKGEMDRYVHVVLERVYGLRPGTDGYNKLTRWLKEGVRAHLAALPVPAAVDVEEDDGLDPLFIEPPLQGIDPVASRRLKQQGIVAKMQPQARDAAVQARDLPRPDDLDVPADFHHDRAYVHDAAAAGSVVSMGAVPQVLQAGPQLPKPEGLPSRAYRGGNRASSPLPRGVVDRVAVERWMRERLTATTGDRQAIADALLDGSRDVWAELTARAQALFAQHEQAYARFFGMSLDEVSQDFIKGLFQVRGDEAGQELNAYLHRFVHEKQGWHETTIYEKQERHPVRQGVVCEDKPWHWQSPAKTVDPFRLGQDQVEHWILVCGRSLPEDRNFWYRQGQSVSDVQYAANIHGLFDSAVRQQLASPLQIQDKRGRVIFDAQKPNWKALSQWLARSGYAQADEAIALAQQYVTQSRGWDIEPTGPWEFCNHAYDVSVDEDHRMHRDQWSVRDNAPFAEREKLAWSSPASQRVRSAAAAAANGVDRPSVVPPTTTITRGR